MKNEGGQQIKFDFFGIRLALLSSARFSATVGVLCLTVRTQYFDSRDSKNMAYSSIHYKSSIFI